MDETEGMIRDRASSGRLRATIIAGPDQGRSLRVDRVIVVGTSDKSDFVLTDKKVSRRHLTLEPFGGAIRVRDEGSRNGTFYGELRIVEAELPPDGELRFGETVLKIDVDRFAAEKSARKTRDAFGRFVGRSACLESLYATLERAAATDATVLLEGESGTGKELLAEALHEQSPRSAKPFVVVDCGSVPETLIESELFGHEKGAFTGAERRRIGAFEEANGGTVFLDEIGELPLNLQTRLLRVLDRRQCRRLGGDQTIDIDVRVIAATNRNLDREVEESRFRLDLYHRLALILVRVPPLRDRLDDLELLATEFAARFGKHEALPPEMIQRMKAQRWPGNVRELRNYVERFCLLGEVSAPPAPRSAPLDPLRDAAHSGLAYRHARELVLEAFTSAYVADMLARNGNNVSRAARASGIARRHFHRLKQIF
jgi:DNA-binding NtrC family response regulator